MAVLSAVALARRSTAKTSRLANCSLVTLNAMYRPPASVVERTWGRNGNAHHPLQLAGSIVRSAEKPCVHSDCCDAVQILLSASRIDEQCYRNDRHEGFVPEVRWCAANSHP